MKVFLSLIACLLFISTASLNAQSRIVSGQVFSKKTNQPISGASIILRGTTIGTLSDLNGRYVLNVNQEDFTLVYSYIGYQTEEVIFGSEDSMNVYLTPLPEVKEEEKIIKEEKVEEEEEEVPDPQKDDARSKVTGDLIENIPYQSFDRALQGRTPGLLVKAAGGIPGGVINARIRGVGSILAGNEPLYIVDGVLINNTSFSLYTQSNPLAFLNPNEIESVEVLKDAASTAIYGNQGANGVILVTTKKGKTGKMRLELNAYAGETMPIKYFDLLDGPEWYTMRRDAYRNSGNVIPEALTLSNMGILPQNWNQLSPAELDAIGTSVPTYDWQRQMMGNSMLHNYELNASGGSNSTLYYVSGSYHYSGSTFSPVDFERGTVRASLSHTIKNRLRLEANVNLATIGQNVPFTTDGAFLGNPAYATSLILRHNPIFNEDGSYNTEIGGLAGQNIAMVNDYNSGQAKTDAAVGNFVVNYKLAPNLNYKGLVGMDYRAIEEYSFRDPRTPDGAPVNGRNSAAVYNVARYMTNHTVDWTKKLDNSLLSAYLGYEFLTEERDGYSSIATGASSASWDNSLSGLNIISSDTLWAGYKRQGAFLGVNYQIAEKYLIHVGTRYDGSSRFGSNFRYGWFPFVKLGWNLANEDFLSNSGQLSDLRIRASWGLSGNDQIGDFRAIGMFGQGNTYSGGSGIRPISYENPNLRWETNETLNFGLDFGLSNGKVTGSIDLFERKTKDLILNIPILWINNSEAFLKNIGGLRNRGVEFEINTVNFERGIFSWYSSFNFSYIKNEVTSLYDGLQSIPENPRWAVGQPVGNPAFPGDASPGSWFVAEYAGVNPATGRPMWFDANGNTTYLPTNDDRVYWGSNFPPYFGGFNNTFKIKGFELTTFFTYEYGAIVSDGQYNFLRDNANVFTFNGLREINERSWREPGDITDMPRNFAQAVGDGARSQNRNFGSASLLKADFIRLAQVKIAYSFEPELLRNMGLSQARIYAQGINLWTYTDYPGYDPEFMGSGTGQIPVHKSYNIGIQLSF
jgi:TonB-dependent starch-binding outer membrane protein SusC